MTLRLPGWSPSTSAAATTLEGLEGGAHAQRIGIVGIVYDSNLPSVDPLKAHRSPDKVCQRTSGPVTFESQPLGDGDGRDGIHRIVQAGQG